MIRTVSLHGGSLMHMHVWLPALSVHDLAPYLVACGSRVDYAKSNDWVCRLPTFGIFKLRNHTGFATTLQASAPEAQL